MNNQYDPNDYLHSDCTQSEIDQALDGGDPMEVDEDEVVQLAYEELDDNQDRVVEMYDPVAADDQDFTIDKDGQVGVKFEFTVWVNPCDT